MAKIKIQVGLLVLLLFHYVSSFKIAESADQFISNHKLDLDEENDTPLCMQKQSCDWIGCHYGVYRYFKYQNSMVTYVKETKFKDEFFPASTSSLYWEKFVKDQSDAYNEFSSRVKKWARPTDMYPRRAPSLWGDHGVQSHGLRQGMLGDCWILGSAAALAENPERLKKVFTQSEYDMEGMFELELWHKGANHKVIVDDRLPMYKMPSTPISFQMSDNGAWWATILEKAYAKMHQNYVRLSGGLSFESLRTLTGMPVIPHFPMYFPQKYDELTIWQILSEGEKRNHVMTGQVFANSNGLVAGHTYTILGVAEAHKDKVEKLVKLRNPWATDKYTGPYADKDPELSKETETLPGLNKTNQASLDGIFYMPMSLFKQTFGSFSIGMYQQTWILSQTIFDPLTESQKTLATKINNPIQQELVVTLDGMPARMLPETCAPSWPKNVPGQIALLGPNNHVIEKQIIFPHHNYGWIHVKSLPPGEYIVYIQFTGKGPVQGLRNVSLSSYGIHTCAKINEAPCALITSGQKNLTADMDEGTLEETKPVHDPTEKTRPIASPNKLKKSKTTGGESKPLNASTTLNASTNGTSNPAPSARKTKQKTKIKSSVDSNEDSDSGNIGSIDEFAIDDNQFQWSSRAKILKESLDQLVEALRIVDKKYQQLQRWDSQLEGEKIKIEHRKAKIQAEYETLVRKLQLAGQDAAAYDRYAVVLDQASQTVGQITHGLQGVKLSQVDVNIPSDPSFIQTQTPPQNHELLQIENEQNLMGNPESDGQYLEMFGEAIRNVEPLDIPKDLIVK